ncbi:2-amino-4-hydroxy-6-hydroxymethyldihydropteridine diphosphokinase [Chondrinema litorale]|uniref:2-amino-4-hydroxy-6- hydroxymethyldihydropteridine diphosphokinase n=1 Tax=Chondrinema litorale TaxID=2994555 RepID=UPI002544B1AB|nr:2-amino-4-hydroxy-6-hydroxymethyldihydropteridine diphosphokinase [Chondrinema litorale]UZR94806.1 2-amino-4-hydroxy-6-hydroxymethyldihydropteridine diphosphokinase [Chondrinema litorale]
MNKVYLLLGANLGNRSATLRKAASYVTENIGEILQESAIYETEAWGVRDQPDFLNQVLLVNTELSALEVLDCTQAIEYKLGRQRKERWHARTIDIDILFFNEEIIEHPRLTVPHPAISERKFTLDPLAELSPKFMHPLLYKSIQQLLYTCKDPLEVRKYSGEERHSA